MSYKIYPTKEFEKDFRKLDSLSKKRVAKKIGEVAENPTRYKRII